MKPRSVQTADDLAELLPKAAAGETAELFRRLEVGSGLPGPRMNLNLAVAFAHACAQVGPKVDDLVYRMANLPAGEARGAAPREFLTVCGVLGIGARAMAAKENAVRERALALLDARADDPRFRVRDAVPLSLAMLGSKMKDDLADRVEPWMDRYFHAAAVVRALAEPAWLETFEVEDYYAPINLLHDAFLLAHDAPRSAIRYPGHKALVEALSYAPKAVAKRFGIPMFDRLLMWAELVKVPELRDVILANLDDAAQKKPFREEIRLIHAAIEAGKKPPRDPTRLVQGMRGRAKRRGGR
jgi:hypothetical protein